MSIKQIKDNSNTLHDLDNRSITLTADSGTLTTDQLAILQASNQNYIIDESGYIYRFVANDGSVLTYQRFGHASKKSQVFSITISTRAYTFNEITLSTLTLGTSSSTAYRGDRGNTAYTHASDANKLTTATTSGLYKVASTNQGHIASLTAVTKADITGLGIPASDTNTTYSLTQDSTDGHKITLTPSSGTAQTITIPDNNTTYSVGTGLSLSGTTFNHSNSVTAGTVGTSSATSGSTLAVPYVTYDAQGHVTASGTHTHTVTGFATTDTKNTAGSTDTSSKIFLVGATSQAANPQTYSNSNVYEQDGNLYASNMYGNLIGDVTGNVSGTASNVTGTVAVANGGTGATNAANARTNLGLELYGICSTAGGTAAKTVTVSGFTSLYDGLKITVLFTNSNNASNPTLNVNGSGAKQIIRYGTTPAGTSGPTSWFDNTPLDLIYDATNSYWRICSLPNTLRAVKVNGTDLIATISYIALNFVNGNNVTITGSGGNVTISSELGYPVVTTLPATVAWNTEYRLASSISALSFTMPAITSRAEEVRIVFEASADITASITMPSGVTLYGAGDVSITSGNRYELSVACIGPTHMAVVCKEWSAS